MQISSFIEIYRESTDAVPNGRTHEIRVT